MPGPSVGLSSISARVSWISSSVAFEETRSRGDPDRAQVVDAVAVADGLLGADRDGECVGDQACCAVQHVSQPSVSARRRSRFS